MIKCVALDMDGTLLQPNLTISKQDLEAIWEAKNKGVDVIINSGRSYASIHFFLEVYNLPISAVSLNGANIHNEAGTRIYSKGLNETELNESLNAFSNAGFSIINLLGGALRLIESSDFPANLTNSGIESFSRTYQDKIYKISAMGRDEALTNAASALTRFELAPMDRSIELTAPGTNKGTGLIRYCETKGIDPKETMVIGDNGNDISMFHKAGLAVAMAHADQEIKNQADTVTKTNTEHGVAYAINKYVLQK
ncbi:MAG: HAD family phosphatase [Bacillaceae bacterium]|nr:HAD family phosphatase [Bacillaceae bacterium]